MVAPPSLGMIVPSLALIRPLLGWWFEAQSEGPPARLDAADHLLERSLGAGGAIDCVDSHTNTQPLGENLRVVKRGDLDSPLLLDRVPPGLELDAEGSLVVPCVLQ